MYISLSEVLELLVKNYMHLSRNIKYPEIYSLQ